MKNSNKINEFNLLIVGTGGQGQITLLQVLAEAAFIDNFDFKSSELHGLSQRGGSVKVHIRFGKQIYSPMIEKNKTDLILGLEMQESLTSKDFAGPETIFLVNEYFIPIIPGKKVSQQAVLKELEKTIKNIFLIPANEVCQKELGTSVVAGVYLISLASFKKIIPIKPESILKAIKKIIPLKHQELNVKAFNLASQSEAMAKR